MSTEKIRHLDEHLPYELLMLRYTHKHLPEPHHQLDFNCFLECFGIHARILYEFLTNDKDARNFKASDFVDYRPSSHNEILGAMQRLHGQILHLSKRRPSQPEEKFDTADADSIRKWIEGAFSLFLSALSHEYKSHWNADRADPVRFKTHSLGLASANTTTGVVQSFTGPSAPPSEAT